MSVAVAISGSPSVQSKSRRLLGVAVDRLVRDGVPGRTVDLCELATGDLLGRTQTPAIEEALAAVTTSRLLIVGTPVYRASIPAC